MTELVTGIDLIQEQIRVASGEALRFRQKDIQTRGHAIECRINAEDPAMDFQPSPGLISVFVPPGGPAVRMDSHCFSGYRIPPNYDSMIGKLLVHRPSREEAIRTMMRALDEFVIEDPRRRSRSCGGPRAGRVPERRARHEVPGALPERGDLARGRRGRPRSGRRRTIPEPST